MFCTKCGNPAEQDDAYCATCGGPLRASEPPQAAQPQRTSSEQESGARIRADVPSGSGIAGSVWPLHDSLAVWDDVSAKRLATKVNRGTELRVVNRDRDYYAVRLPNDTIGYVYASSVSEVRSPSPSTYSGSELGFTPSDRVTASFWHRVGGSLIDSVIGFVGGLLLGIALYALLLPDAYTQEDLDMAQVQVTLISFVVSFGYKWMMDSNGGTLGKLIVGLRVVDDTTMEPPGLGPGFVRTLVSLGSGMALGLGYLWAAWDSEGKTWHDHAGGTIVVRR